MLWFIWSRLIAYCPFISIMPKESEINADPLWNFVGLAFGDEIFMRVKRWDVDCIDALALADYGSTTEWGQNRKICKTWNMVGQ